MGVSRRLQDNVDSYFYSFRQPFLGDLTFILIARSFLRFGHSVHRSRMLCFQLIRGTYDLLVSGGMLQFRPADSYGVSNLRVGKGDIDVCRLTRL